MTFRAKLIALVAGVVILPFFFQAFIFYLHGLNARVFGHHPAVDFLSMIQWIDEELPAKWQEGNPEAALRFLPEGKEVLVVDTNGQVVLSTVPGFKAGETPIAGTLYSSLMEGEEYRLDVNPVLVDGKTVGVVILKFPRRPEPAALLGLRLEGPLVYLSGAMIVGTILIIVVIASLRSQIGRLQKATAKVAGGDLDFELRAHGNDELATLTRSFESMRKALQEEYAKNSRFLMAVSHDLKTPLTAIKGYLEAILDGMAEDPEILRNHISIIRDKSRILEERIYELIEYVKLSTGQWQLKYRPINLKRFIEGLGRSLSSDASVFRRDFTCNIELPDDLEILGDEGLLTRALDNLFHNTLRYTREGDAIDLSARMEGAAAVITFADTGPGVGEEELERIFEPFYRGTGSRREAGTGLGLSTVRSILSAHHWSIQAVSSPGHGLTFIIHVQTMAEV